MISTSIVGVALALVAVSVLHRGGGSRTLLLRCIATAILASALLRESEVMYTLSPLMDLLKRLIFLVAQAAVMSLVLTFRRPPVARQVFLWLWAGAAAVGLFECMLFLIMPTRVEPTIFAHAATSTAAFFYYALYETSIGVTAIFCALGSVMVLVRARQPFAAQWSLLFLLTAAVVSVMYVAVGWHSLVHSYSGDHLWLRRRLFLVAISLLLTGMTASGVHGALARLRAWIGVRVASDVVAPLWCCAVKLQPAVMLPVYQLTRRERLLRLVVETNDALHRISLGPGRCLGPAGATGTTGAPDITDAQKMAQMLTALLGQNAVPGPLSRRTRLLVNLGVLNADDALLASVKALYNIRVAFTVRTREPSRSSPTTTPLAAEAVGWFRLAR